MRQTVNIQILISTSFMWIWVNILTYLSFIICEMGLCVISTLSKLIILSTQKSAGAHALNNHSLLIFYRQCAMPVLASSLNKIQNFEFNLFLSDCIIMRVYGCFDFSYVQIYQGTICAVVSTLWTVPREKAYILWKVQCSAHMYRGSSTPQHFILCTFSCPIWTFQPLL